MRNFALAAFALATLPLTVFADPGKNEGWHGKGHGSKHKEEYWDGNCKVVRKWDKHGRYKEERKCKPVAQVYQAPPPVVVHQQPVYVQPAPVYVQPAPVYVQPAPMYVPPPPVVIEPPNGLVIQGTVRLK